MINRNIITYSFIATALTFGMMPTAQAATIPTPTVTQSQVTDNSNPFAFVPVDSLNPVSQNTAILIEDVSVNNSVNSNQSTVYKVCFDYGTFEEVFPTLVGNPARTDLPCNDALGFQLSDLPEFWGNGGEAALAAGGVDPDPPTLENPAKSNGIRTALNNTFDTNDDIRRILGENLTPGSPFGNTQTGDINFVIPYETIDTSNVRAVAVQYNGDGSGVDEWAVTELGVGVNITTRRLYARFEQTDTVDVTPPSPIELPEPATIIGLLIAGTAGLITTRRC